MTDFEEAMQDLNTAALESLGAVMVVLQNPGGGSLQFRAIRGARQQPDNDQQLSAFERVWTTTAELIQSPVVGGTVVMAGVEYVVHAVNPDADPMSNGFTIYLNRKRPINA